jgi:hypothetical protein
MTIGRYVSPIGQVLGGKGLTPDERVVVFPGETGDRDQILERGSRSSGRSRAQGRLARSCPAASAARRRRPSSSRSFRSRSAWRCT